MSGLRPALVTPATTASRRSRSILSAAAPITTAAARKQLVLYVSNASPVEVGEIPVRIRRVPAKVFKRSAALLGHMKERGTRIGEIEAPGQMARAEEIIEGREQGLVFIAG